MVLSPTLYDNGPAGTVDIEAALNGTGVNTFALQAQVLQPNGGVTPSFFLGTTNVTANVLAGTEVITCYAGPGSCPPLKAVLAPGSGSGTFFMSVSLTSTIDGQAAYGYVVAQLVWMVMYLVQLASCSDHRKVVVRARKCSIVDRAPHAVEHPLGLDSRNDEICALARAYGQGRSFRRECRVRLSWPNPTTRGGTVWPRITILEKSGVELVFDRLISYPPCPLEPAVGPYS